MRMRNSLNDLYPMSGGEDHTALSFHDSLLKVSDIALLSESNWLNDKIIGFYFEYLEYVTFRDYSSQVCFITPDVTQFIKLYQGCELGIFLGPLNLHEKDLILLAINDNSSEGAGGSHWSLLTYSRRDNIYRHYDSSRPTNSSAAHQCSLQLTPFIKASLQPKYREVENCPQQENCSDCGVYAMCFARAICARELTGEDGNKLMDIGPEDTKTWRSHVQSLISSLAKGEVL